MSRQRFRLRPCTLVYLTMIGLTLATFSVGVAGLSGLGISLTVLAFALIKGQMLGDFFMGLICFDLSTIDTTFGSTPLRSSLKIG